MLDFTAKKNFLNQIIKLLNEFDPNSIDNIYEFENNEIEFTQKHLVPEIKYSLDDLIQKGLIVKGPGDVAIPSFQFFNSKSITDIVFIQDSNQLLSIEVKILNNKGNRNQNISTAIGQGIIQSLSKFEFSLIYILDFNNDVASEDITLLRNSLSNIDVHLIYKTVDV